MTRGAYENLCLRYQNTLVGCLSYVLMWAEKDRARRMPFTGLLHAVNCPEMAPGKTREIVMDDAVDWQSITCFNFFLERNYFL